MLTSRRADDILPRSWKRNKRADELTRSSKKKKIISNGGGETTELLISGDLHRGSNQCIWSELGKEVASNLSKSVVSLALPNGQELACSGIALECVGNVTRFLTSASLARALIGNRSDHDNLKVEVRLGRDVVTGFLGEYDLDHEIAVVIVVSVLDVHVVRLDNMAKLEPACKVVALGHGISGDVMATDGILTGNSSRELKLSTCKISKAGIGGPLLDFDGRFIGMNFYEKKVGTPYLNWREIVDVLEHFKTEGSVAKVDHGGKPSCLPGWTMAEDRSVGPNRWSVPKPYWCHPDDPKIQSTGSLIVYSNGHKQLYV